MQYDQVVVLAPYEIITKEVNLEDNPQTNHEEILESMLPKSIWQDMKEESITNFGIPVCKKASHLAFDIGMSVIYETENNIFVFVGSYITEEHLNYIKDNYGEYQGKTLDFVTQTDLELTEKRQYEGDDFTKYNNALKDLIENLEKEMVNKNVR